MFKLFLVSFDLTFEDQLSIGVRMRVAHIETIIWFIEDSWNYLIILIKWLLDIDQEEKKKRPIWP